MYVVIALFNIYNKKKNYVVEMILGEIFMILLNAMFHTVTIVPDAYGRQSACRENQKLDMSLLYKVSTDHCGDMIWSGHVSHTFFSLILIYWCLTEWIENIEIFRICYWIPVTLLLIAEMVLIVMIEHHYTIDVILSFVFVPLIVTHQMFQSTVKRCEQIRDK